jgi:hypothetical protein
VNGTLSALRKGWPRPSTSIQGACIEDALALARPTEPGDGTSP